MREQLVKNSKNIYDGINRCTSITVHETANTSIGADAEAHANLQSNGNVRQASWHVQADGKQAIRSFPDTAQCWHGGTREANEGSLAIEICVNADGDYEAAFKIAAGVVRDWRIKHKLSRADVKQHFDWTGKNCPAQMRLAARWEEFLDLTEPKGATMPKMCSPFEGRVTSNHHKRGGYKGHKGLDIGPPKPGQTKRPVYAAFPMRIKKLWRSAEPGDKSSTWAPGRTSNGLLGANVGAGTSNDGEGNGYGHMLPLASLKVNDFVDVGELIGYNDRSGVMSGPHIHFELWEDWEDSNSDYDPVLAFEKHKIKPGSAPVVNAKPSKPKPPISKPKPPAKPAPTGSVVDWLAAHNRDSCFAARKKLATQYGIRNYTGTASQNISLLGKLQGGKPAGRSISTMAKEVIAGKHGNGHSTRQKSLGIDSATYARVKAEVNKRA